MKKRTLTRIVGALLMAAPLVTMSAQSLSQQLAPNRLATNLAGATTSVAPPEGFDALRASDSDLAAYGFPPRPDANLEPAAFATWSKAMLASKTRVFPQLHPTGIFHGKKQSAVTASLADGTGTSSNWNALVDFSGATSYNSTTSFYYLIADFVVPVDRQAFGTCNSTYDYTASWVGIDGDNSSDVLQAGTQTLANCSSTSYYAWYEWYPYGEVSISNFPVAPGDDIFVEVWNTSATQGYAYLVNYNNNQAVEIGFTAPSGTKLVGNSAEWVVERPGVGGGLATLDNYISDYFSDCYAYTHAGTVYTPGTSGATNLTMVDNSGYAISYATLLGTNAIWFQDENSARFSSQP